MQKVISYRSVGGFWRAAGALFTADPVRNTVALTVLGRLRAGGRFGAAAPVMLTVHDRADADRLVGAVLCTPPFPIMVSALPLAAVDALIDYLLAHGIRPSGVSGLRPEVEAFLTAWSRRTGVVPSGQLDQRLYRLGELAPPVDVPGAPEFGSAADLDLLVDWRARFIQEALAQQTGRHATRKEMAQQIQDSMAAGNAQLIWRVDGEPVALAAVNTPQGGMSRIGPVYTPQEVRGHGYGSAVTAAASQFALDRGAEHVLLFADLANPVSNSIYQRIGFVPIADAMDVTFAQVPLP